MADFITNFRNAIKNANLTVPSPLERLQAVPTQNQNNTQNRVWGFDQDKVNYGNERDGSKLTWRSLTAHNNDTGEDIKIDVGYDNDGRISGVRQWDSGSKAFGHYGQDSVGSFFKKNFNRDATDYTIFDNIDPGDGRKYVVFDSKNDGAFIPSVALNKDRKSEAVPYIGDNVDGTEGTISDWLRHYRSRANAENSALITQEDESQLEAAENGSLYAVEMRSLPRNKEELDFFEQNSDGFASMAMEFSRTPDANVRKQMLQEAYRRYGSLPKFRAYLNIMAADEDAYEKGRYDDYDYRIVGQNIAKALDSVYRSIYSQA